MQTKSKRRRPRTHQDETRTLSVRGERQTILNIQAHIAQGVMLSRMGLSDAQVLEQALAEYVAARDEHRNFVHKKAQVDPIQDAARSAELNRWHAEIKERRRLRVDAAMAAKWGTKR